MHLQVAKNNWRPPEYLEIFKTHLDTVLWGLL